LGVYKLIKLILSFLILSYTSSAFSGSQVYYNPIIANDVFFQDQQAACDATRELWIADILITVPHQTFTLVAIFGGPSCAYQFTRGDGFSGITSWSKDGISSGAVFSRTCVAGELESFSLAIGRELFSAGDSSFTSFNSKAPLQYCTNGCFSDRTPNQSPPLFGLPDPSNPDYEIIYANIEYTQTESSCNTPDNPPPPIVPDIPPPDPCIADPTAAGCGTGGTGGTGDTGTGGTGTGGTGTGGTGTGDTGTGGTGTGDTGTGGTGTGDTGTGGTGTGTGDTGSTGSSYSGLTCNENFTCTGDAVQCAQLQIANMSRCASETATNYPGQLGQVEGFLASESTNSTLDEGAGDIDVAALFNGPGQARFLPSTCPVAESFNLQLAGGKTFEFSYLPLCQFAIDLSYLIVVVASLFFAVYVGRSVGGS
jgi:hypothetical protein